VELRRVQEKRPGEKAAMRLAVDGTWCGAGDDLGRRKNRDLQLSNVVYDV
jgi:hypothetical protein